MLKIGTSVKIKSLDWFESQADKYGNVSFKYNTFVQDMKEFCGKIGEVIALTSAGNYSLSVDNGSWNWTEEMFDIINITQEVYKFGDFYVIANNATKEISTVLYDTEEEAKKNLL